MIEKLNMGNQQNLHVSKFTLKFTCFSMNYPSTTPTFYRKITKVSHNTITQ